MKTESAIECYIVRHGRFTEVTPAKVVRETQSTITVTVEGAATDYERTFNKEKVYGEGYRAARAMNTAAYGLRSGLRERGNKWSMSVLSFDLERAAELAKNATAEKDANQRAIALREKLRGALQSPNGEPEFAALLTRLETALNL